jgi:hypothetical protein
MPRRQLATVTGVAVVLVVALLVLLGRDPGSSPPAGAGSPDPGQTATTVPDPSAATGGRGGQDAAADRSRPEGAGVEVLPGQPAADSPGTSPGEASGLPGLSESEPARAGSRRVVTAAPRSVVAAHQRSTDGHAVQVALTADNRSSAAFVLRYYRTRLGRLAFTEVRVPAVAGTSVAAFRKGKDSVTVTVTPRSEGGVTYSVLGTLRSSRS